MERDDCTPFVVTHIHEIEIDVAEGDPSQSAVVILAATQEGEDIAVTFSFSLLPQIRETIDAAMARFPGGAHTQ